MVALQPNAMNDQTTPKTPPPIPRILLSDDDPDTLLMLKTLFERNGYHVCGEAQTGVETIVQVVEKHPDVLILDIRMPQGNGLTILPVLREIDPKLCIIMLTADNTSESVHTAISLGAKGYIAKRFLDPGHLLSVVNRAAGLPMPSMKQPSFVEESTVETDQAVKVVADGLPGVAKVYITGGLHANDYGGVFFYHPLSASREEGEVKSTYREILRHPNFFMGLFKRIEGFKEIPGILYNQGMTGGIFELILEPKPSVSRMESMTFAIRHYTPAELESLPPGLAPDGRPYTVYDTKHTETPTSLPNQYPLNVDMECNELPGYLCSFSGLTLETCLFLSAFNILSILEQSGSSWPRKERMLLHVREVQGYASWQQIPKAVLFGSLRLLPCPAAPDTNLSVTSSLSENQASSEDRADLYYWMDGRSYGPHLKHFVNRWSLSVVPLLQLEPCGTFSLLIGHGQRHRYGIKDSMDPIDVFDEKGYASCSLEELTRRFESVRLPDLMRPLLLNTLLARFPSLRLEPTLESPSDIYSRGNHIKEILSGNGLQAIERSIPFLYREACDELRKHDINESNPNYVKELLRRITARYSAVDKLPAKSKQAEEVSEEEVVKRKWAAEKELLKQRFREKYEEK